MTSDNAFRSPPPSIAHVAVAAVPLRYLFSGEFRFVLPWFQRAYAWTQAQIGRLASSLRDAMKEPAPRQPYPLGTLILARPPGERDTALVDGHQRLMTLTIIFSVLRDLEPDAEHRARLDALIADPDVADRAEGYRLKALADAAELLVTHVQAPGSTTLDHEAELGWHELSISEQHILQNRDYLRDEITALLPSPEERRTLADYLLDDCWVIVHFARDEDEAWRRLRLDEDTRLDFDAENRAKASLLSVVPRQDRQAAADCWARCEQLVPPSDLVSLLHHIRLLYIRPKNFKHPIEVDTAAFFDLRSTGRRFFEDTLVPEAQAMRNLKRAEIGCDGAVRPLTCLGWLDRDLWLPPALLWQKLRGDDVDATTDFYVRLERLMWAMRIAGIDPTHQERRLAHVIQHVRAGKAPKTCAQFTVDDTLRTSALAALRAPRIGTRRLIGSLLRRISFALGPDPGPLDGKLVTVEHLLPRNPKPGSEWQRLFRSKKQIEANTYRLGNLTFMTDRENQRAGSKDWPLKLEVLADTKFALSAGLVEAEQWSADTIAARTERLIETLFAEWDLKVS